MYPFSLEHSKWAYYLDFVVYGCTVLGLAIALVATGVRRDWPATAALVLIGITSWTLIEYLLHRFILHGLQPFRRWHTAHHQRPTALISIPTIFSVFLIATLFYLPAMALSSPLRACAYTLGIVVGYLAYTITHHATHHWGTQNAWLGRRKRWHAIHHHAIGPSRCFGVTSSFWDHVFGSAHAKGK